MKGFPLSWRLIAGASVLAMAIPLASAMAQPADAPVWAFPGNQPAKPPSAEKIDTLKGSKQKFTEVQIKDRTTAVDWFPTAHATMPPAVKGGRGPVFACGYCHLPQGLGRTESMDVAGLPENYLKQQLADMRSGARTAMDPRYGPGNNMLATAKLTSAADADEAAKYFASLKFTTTVKVVESADVPAHRPNAFVYEFEKEGAREALGDRIIEGPDDFEAFELRDPRVSFTAYVPVGSVARGAALAKGDGMARPACAGCHGADLKGGLVGPPIAGRYPTGLFRQLYAFKIGSRNGPGAAFMKPMVASLSQKDMIDLAAYVGSLKH